MVTLVMLLSSPLSLRKYTPAVTYRTCKEVIVHILLRLALEGLALEEYKNERISQAELRRLLGSGTRYRHDGFLKAHKILEKHTMAEFEQEREDLRRLGF